MVKRSNHQTLGQLKARPRRMEDTHEADTLTNDSLQHVSHFLALSLSPSLPHYTWAGTAYRSQTHFFIYINVCFTSFPQTSFLFFFLTGARSRHIPDVPITFHSWIHLNPPLPRSSVFDTHTHNTAYPCFICPRVAIN